jgi:hypothetical protein
MLKKIAKFIVPQDFLEVLLAGVLLTFLAERWISHLLGS